MPELAAHGISRRAARDALQSGLLRRILFGVYVPADLEDTTELRIAAALKVIAPGSIARDRTAAWIHGIDTLNYGEQDVLPPIETCVLRWHAPTRRAEVDGGTRDLAPGDVMQIGALRVTTPLRTAMDLGCFLKRRTALATLDAFMRRHGITREEMVRQLPRFRGRRGVVQLRELLQIADPRSESARESWTRLAMIDAGLPRPTLQYWIEIDGVPTWRLDIAYPRQRIAIEYDGADWHEKTDEQCAHDAKRRAWLECHGWTVIVVKKDGFSPGGAGSWLDEVAAALKSQPSTMRWPHRRNVGGSRVNR